MMEDVQMKKKSTRVRVIRLISLLLGIAAAAASAAYILYRFFGAQMHAKKWQDYEDCGI